VSTPNRKCGLIVETRTLTETTSAGTAIEYTGCMNINFKGDFMKRITNWVLIGFTCISVMACGKKGSSSAVATAPVVTYSINSTTGKCMDSNGTEVNMSLCNPNTSNTAYHYNNGICCDGSNNQVNNSYCTGNGGQICSGFYWFIDYDGSLWSVTCNPSGGNSGNCSNYDLIQGSNGDYVYCK
jgi:hypothetical protein